MQENNNPNKCDHKTEKKTKPSHSEIHGLMLFLFMYVAAGVKKHNLKVLGGELAATLLVLMC